MKDFKKDLTEYDILHLGWDLAGQEEYTLNDWVLEKMGDRYRMNTKDLTQIMWFKLDTYSQLMNLMILVDLPVVTRDFYPQDSFVLEGRGKVYTGMWIGEPKSSLLGEFVSIDNFPMKISGVERYAIHKADSSIQPGEYIGLLVNTR